MYPDKVRRRVLLPLNVVTLCCLLRDVCSLDCRLLSRLAYYAYYLWVLLVWLIMPLTYYYALQSLTLYMRHRFISLMRNALYA